VEALKDLAAGRSRAEVTHVEWWRTRIEYTTHGQFGGLGLKTIEWMVFGFGPQNPDVGSEEERDGTWWNHRGCVKAKLIYARSVVVRSTEIGLDHNTLRLGASI